MPAVIHLVGADAGVSVDVVVDDVLALGVAGEAAQLVIAGPGALERDHGVVVDGVLGRRDLRAALGDRLLPVVGPGMKAGLRDLVCVDAIARALRDLRYRHERLALHAHGAHARSLAAVVGRSLDLAVIVDAVDERPAHRLMLSAAI
jgi:hypothetical protein